jgi:L-ascorbate metabolism protein UlaG (beta-lactamase superfamily)
VRVTWAGHSTVLIELEGLRVLTDPVLRTRVAHILRDVPLAGDDVFRELDAVLVSHMHHDHFDPPSLRKIDRRTELIVPRGARKACARLGFEHVTELGVGDSAPVGAITVTGTYAAHRAGRLWGRGPEAIGFIAGARQRLYFAGDTDIFPGMRDLRGELDVALLPVGGWGPKLGPGHLDAHRAAEALALLEPRVAVPIHWGTLHRVGMARSRRALLNDPPHAFARKAAEIAPEVDVRILQPGETTTVG